MLSPHEQVLEKKKKSKGYNTSWNSLVLKKILQFFDREHQLWHISDAENKK